MRARQHAEDEIQSAVVAWVRTVAPDVLIFAVPNGGFRTKPEAAILKRMGVVAGIPDLCGVTADGRPFFLEVKEPEGCLSKAQGDLAGWLMAHGVLFKVVRSIDDVRSAFGWWKIETREAA